MGEKQKMLSPFFYLIWSRASVSQAEQYLNHVHQRFADECQKLDRKYQGLNRH
jgi:hypothetical protein